MLVIAVIALLIFGPGKMPEIGKSLGKGISNFKRAFAAGEAASAEDKKPSDQKTIEGSDHE